MGTTAYQSLGDDWCEYVQGHSNYLKILLYLIAIKAWKYITLQRCLKTIS